MEPKKNRIEVWAEWLFYFSFYCPGAAITFFWSLAARHWWKCETVGAMGFALMSFFSGLMLVTVMMAALFHGAVSESPNFILAVIGLYFVLAIFGNRITRDRTLWGKDTHDW